MSALQQNSSIQQETEQARNIGAALFGIIALAIYKSLETWAEKYRRGQLLAAYRRRHAWKKSDIARLEALGVNATARRRMEHLTGRGRPVVNELRPLDEEIIEKLKAVQLLTDPKASPALRRQAFKMWPWWPHYVEALYRGEHAKAKAECIKSPSEEAERSVGRTLGISAATVHSICGEIRRKRKDDPRVRKFPGNDHRRI